MIRITRILCPVDFSEFSHRALDHAAAIARWYEAALTVLYVFPTMPVMDLPPLVLDDENRDRLTASLRELAAVVPSDVALDLRVQDANVVHEEILRQAEDLGADLLVIGSHGRSGFGRLLLGSVTEKLMRSARCPTLVVSRRAADAAPEAPVRFHRILCPVDFSDGSRAALAHATSMAEEADAQLTVLHVIEVPPELREHAMAGSLDVDGMRAAAEADRLTRLRELIPSEARTFCTVETAVREGAAYREILRVAAERQADLIVMGVHGRGALDLLVFGSNTARVTRAATCPVLVVRHG
jgi:nucleotide-binding universal stress UspA family protein